MARWMERTGWIAASVGMALASCPLAAQSLWLPASDPVGIARSGAGVAFGRSLEAGSLNPALLVTLLDQGSFYIAAGQDLQAKLITAQSNQFVNFSSDRNRFMPAFGAAWKLDDRTSLGIKLDTPFSRHGRLPWNAPSRFGGLALDLGTSRAEIQGAFALTPAFSVGASLGLMRISYSAESSVRLRIPATPSDPISPTNPSLALLETILRQEGVKSIPSYSLGFRYAIKPRWTIGGTYRSGYKTTLPLAATNTGTSWLVANDGASTPPLGIDSNPLLALSTPLSGRNEIALPAISTLGVRHRLNQVFTWEADLRYVQGASTMAPTMPGMLTPSGQVFATVPDTSYQSGFGISACGEFTLGKNLTVRVGASIDPPFRKDSDIDVLMNGTRTAAFSGGFGWKAFGGEINLGYQFRQTQDRESAAIDTKWTSTVYGPTGTSVRVEGQGHLWSIGFKKSF